MKCPFLHSNPIFILFTLSLPRVPLPPHHFSLYSASFPFQSNPFLPPNPFTLIQSFSFLPLYSTTIPFWVVPPSLTSLPYLSSPPNYSLIIVSYSFDVYVVIAELFIQLDNYITYDNYSETHTFINLISILPRR